MPAYTTDTTETTGRRQVVAAILFVLLSLAVMYLPAGAQQQVASALRATVLRPFLITQEGLARARVRATEAEQLRHQVDSLVAVTSSAAVLDDENRRLRALLSLADRMTTPYVPASVIRPGTAGSESMFLVDRGSEHGVRPNAPAITRQGLVGVIREVGNKSSIGMDWTHPDFRASAMSEDGTTYGIVESYRGDFREHDRLMLNGTAFHTALDDGTIVVTSGLGGVLPRGIPIGRVAGTAEADAGWRKSYWLDPFVEPGSVTHVLVAMESGDSLTGGDLASLWPTDSILTLEAMTAREQARWDSLSALGDSVVLLRAILRDQSAQDSLRRMVAADSAAGIPSPAPPTTGGPPAQAQPTPQRGTPAESAPAPPPRPDTTRPVRPRPTDTLRIRPDTSDRRPTPPPLPDTTRPDTTRPDTTRPDTTAARPASTSEPGGIE